jgi:hypothetical protein
MTDVAAPPYTTQLQAGLGLVRETKALLGLWAEGMSAPQLLAAALTSGGFPTVTARRLRNVVVECFAPRYLVGGGAPAAHLKRLVNVLSSAELSQALLIFTCRATPMLGDFIRQVYWSRYAGGYTHLSNDDARAFVERAMDDGRTAKRWATGTVRRVSGYLTGCCADYGLLEAGTRTSRRILPFRIGPGIAAYLTYELHLSGVGDNALLTHADWKLFGLEREDVLDEIKRMSLKGLLIVQAAGDMIRISWKHQSMEALLDVITEG